jgi:hypothetical protein
VKREVSTDPLSVSVLDGHPWASPAAVNVATTSSPATRRKDGAGEQEARVVVEPVHALRGSLAPESIAGYVRGLEAFGNRCAVEELAAAAGFRALRRPKVPHRLIAPFSDPELRSVLEIGRRTRAGTGARPARHRPPACPNSPRCGWATFARTGRSHRPRRAERQPASDRSRRCPRERSSRPGQSSTQPDLRGSADGHWRRLYAAAAIAD